MVAGYEAASETLSVSTKNVHLRGNHVVERRQESSWRRLTAPTLTTTRCNAIHLEDYQAELQLVYSYLVEFAAGGSRSLSGIERAITHAIAQELDDCDVLDRPSYKVKTNTRHAFSKERTYLCIIRNSWFEGGPVNHTLTKLVLLSLLILRVLCAHSGGRKYLPSCHWCNCHLAG
jgi:hypothetical protein